MVCPVVQAQGRNNRGGGTLLGPHQELRSHIIVAIMTYIVHLIMQVYYVGRLQQTHNWLYLSHQH